MAVNTDTKVWQVWLESMIALLAERPRSRFELGPAMYHYGGPTLKDTPKLLADLGDRIDPPYEIGQPVNLKYKLREATREEDGPTSQSATSEEA